MAPTMAKTSSENTDFSSMGTYKDTNPQSKQPLSITIIKSIHHNPNALLDIHLCHTPSPIKTRITFDSLNLHKIFGLQWFQNQTHLLIALDNASLLNTGKIPQSLGDYTTIPNPPWGKKNHKTHNIWTSYTWTLSLGIVWHLGDTDMPTACGCGHQIYLVLCSHYQPHIFRTQHSSWKTMDFPKSPLRFWQKNNWQQHPLLDTRKQKQKC